MGIKSRGVLKACAAFMCSRNIIGGHSVFQLHLCRSYRLCAHGGDVSSCRQVMPGIQHMCRHVLNYQQKIPL